MPELLGNYEGLAQRLDAGEDGHWPHVTLGLAREDIPAASMNDLAIPCESGPARSLDLRQAGGDAQFRILVRRNFEQGAEAGQAADG